jgi:hypothetical protein
VRCILTLPSNKNMMSKPRREPSGALFLCHLHLFHVPIAFSMEWTPPHPRRLPTASEIQENQSKIYELDAKIADLKEQLEKLEKDRYIRASFISPFRRLPVEILCEIVVHALKRGQSPISLSNVCASMRAAVIGMKRLWTTISFAPGLPFPRTTFSQST